MRALVFALALVPTLALGQSIQYSQQPVWGKYLPRWMRTTDALYISTGCAGTFSGPGLVTVSRASSEVAQCTSGTWVSASNNALAVTDLGAQVWAGNTNTMLRSDAIVSAGALNAPWTGASLGTLTADATTAPDGTTTADLVTLTAASTSAVLQNITGLSASTTYNCSAWVWTNSGTKSFRISRTNNVSWATATVSATLTATTTPQRFSLPYTTGVGETQSDCVYGGDQKTPFSPSAGVIYIWGDQHETGSVPGPYIATAGTSVARPATVLSVPNAITNVAKFCIGVKFARGTYTFTAAQNTLARTWASSAGTNDAALYFDASGVLTWNTWSGTSAIKGVTWTPSPSFVDGTTHTAVGCWDNGVPTLYADGVSVGSVGGSGTGPASLGASVYLGVRPAGDLHFNGFVYSHCQSTTFAGCRL